MKVLVAIGCDHYSATGLGELSGAENDAKAIFDSLVLCENSLYDQKYSVLLLSPNCQEVRNSLEYSIFDSDQDLELTFYFAGHGASKDGSYFLCVEDTVLDRLSVSAISVTDLFMSINEASIRNTNILIDACQGGGIADDVSAFLKPSEIGKLGSPSVSVLVSATSDQAAKEINGQGVATSAILKCLTGEIQVQTDFPSLSLSDLSCIIPNYLSVDDQSPVYWGLNLFGRSAVASNPHFDERKKYFSDFENTIRSNSADSRVIRSYSNKIWELYLNSYQEFDADDFITILSSLLNDMPSSSDLAAVVISGLADTFQQLLKDSYDPFEVVELLGACITILLQHTSSNDIVEETIYILSFRLLSSIYLAGEKSLLSIKSDPNYLLNSQSIFADLFYLPLRILKILGWVGAAQYFSSLLGVNKPSGIRTNKKLVVELLDQYTNAIVAVSDEQVSSFVVFSSMASSIELADEAEQLFGLLCNTFCCFKGLVAKPSLSGADAYRFVKGRASEDKQAYEDLISSPSEFLSSIILLSDKLLIPDVVDDIMINFDHLSANVFIPDVYSNFAKSCIDEGINFTSLIGSDIWSVKDFMRSWHNIRDKIDSDSSLKSQAVKIAAVCSSLVMPNRVPWFIVDELN